MIKLCSDYPLVVQWIEQETSKLLIEVRFLSRGQEIKNIGLAYDGGTPHQKKQMPSAEMSAFTVTGQATGSCPVVNFALRPDCGVTVARDVWDVLVPVRIRAVRQDSQNSTSGWDQLDWVRLPAARNYGPNSVLDGMLES